MTVISENRRPWITEFTVPLTQEEWDRLFFELTGLTVNDYQKDFDAHVGNQDELLLDFVSLKAFANAIINNRELFEGKVVLDVGSKTGVLSALAAKAGAARVIATEASVVVSKTSKRFLKDNRLNRIVKIVNGTVENITLPYGIEEVDIIISEWMGNGLFNGGMLENVIYARDKWLAPDGLIFPDIAELYITAIEGEEYYNKVQSWGNIHGANMSLYKKAHISIPIVGQIDEKRLVTNPCRLLTMDLNKVLIEDLDFEAPFELVAKMDKSAHAVATYFRVEFSKCRDKTSFSTSPEAALTHWQQITFYVDGFAAMKEGEEISGVFSVEHVDLIGPKDEIFPRRMKVTIQAEYYGDEQCLNTVDSYLVR